MTHTTTVRLAFLLLAATAAVSCGNVKSAKEDAQAAAPAAPTQAELVKRGDYLVNTMGCDDCHSPKRMGAQGPEVIAETRFGGYPANRPVVKPDGGDLKKGFMLFGPDLTSAVGPWGMSFAANISSHETGIGNWTEGAFINAMRKGKIKGLDNGRPMLPPMPWPGFSKLTDEDLKAIFAYLKSGAPVDNRVPDPLNPGQLAQLK